MPTFSGGFSSAHIYNDSQSKWYWCPRFFSSVRVVLKRPLVQLVGKVRCVPSWADERGSPEVLRFAWLPARAVTSSQPSPTSPRRPASRRITSRRYNDSRITKRGELMPFQSKLPPLLPPLILATEPPVEKKIQNSLFLWGGCGKSFPISHTVIFGRIFLMHFYPTVILVVRHPVVRLVCNLPFGLKPDCPLSLLTCVLLKSAAVWGPGGSDRCTLRVTQRRWRPAEYVSCTFDWGGKFSGGAVMSLWRLRGAGHSEVALFPWGPKHFFLREAWVRVGMTGLFWGRLRRKTFRGSFLRPARPLLVCPGCELSPLGVWRC